MCYCIVTARSMVWMLLTLAAFLAMLSAVLTPAWLVANATQSQAGDNVTEMFHPSVGLYNRCTRLNGRKHCASFAAAGLATPDTVFPSYWKSSLVLLSLGLGLVGLTVMSALVSFCIQSVFKKSIFTISGALQSVAGIFYILGLVVYPFGWGSERVQRLCGKDSMPFYLDNCSLGWAFYSSMAGLALTFISALLSIQAEVATSSDKVQYQISQGRNLIIVP